MAGSSRKRGGGDATPRPGREWFTKRELAAVFAVTEHQLWRKYQELIPTRAIQRVGNKDFFHARTLIDALVAHELEQAKPSPASPASTLSPEEAAIFGGAEEKVLDELRRVKIAQERIKLDVMRGDAIPRAHLEMGLALLAGVLRRAIEFQQRRWGNDVAEVMTQALGEAESNWEKMLGDGDRTAANDESPAVAGASDPAPPVGADPDPAAADDAAVRGG